jgi:hypothetical protein
MISRTNDGCKNDSVNEVTSCMCTSHLENNGEGRGRRRLGGKIVVTPRDVKANEKDGNNIEEEDTPEDILHDTGKIFGGILRFTGSDGNGFSSTV